MFVGVEVAVHDVFADCGVEEEDVLLDEAGVFAEESLFEACDVSAVDADGALLGLVEARDEGGDGGLAGAGFADYRDCAVGGDVHAHVAKDPVFGCRVFERDVVKCYTAVDGTKRRGVFAVDDIGGDVHDLGEPLEAGGALLEVLGKVYESADGVEDEVDVQDKRQEVGDIDFAEVDEPYAACDDDEEIALDEEVHYRKENGHDAVHVFLGSFEAEVDLLELDDFLFLVGE